jgi:membrane protease YdiL (CAAX protease family)
VPWGAVEVGVALYLFIATQALAQELLIRTHFFRTVYGEDFPVQVSLSDPADAKRLAAARQFIWYSVLAAPLFVGAVLGLFCLLPAASRAGRAALPYQFGLTRDRGARNLILGYLGWLFLSPAVLGLNVLVEILYLRLHRGGTEEHPLIQLLGQQPSPAEWALVFLSAAVAAPVVEELLFRGILQPWLSRRRWGGDLALAASFALALATRHKEIAEALRLGENREALAALAGAAAPALFVLAMIPGYIMAEWACWRWLPIPHVARGIYGTSLLFATFHSTWPSPIALFPLAFGLGYLAFRTQSLVGPITLHALFNAVSLLGMALCAAGTGEAQPANGKEVTSAVCRPAPDSTSRLVPGASLPRRTKASATVAFSRGETAADVTRPTSLPSRNSFAPGATVAGPAIFKPRKDQLTWPRSRARTMGSWPR